MPQGPKGKVLKSPVIHGEPEEELESHEEDVLGEDLKSESESVLGELGAGVLRPAWVAPPPLAPAGDLQGASFEDLILPGSALLPRVEPTQHAEPAEANLLTGAGFAVVVTPAQEEPGGVARTSWQGAATLRREMQQGAATLRRDMQQAFDIEEAEEFAFPSLQLEVDDLQSCMSGSDAEPGLSIETFQEVVVEEDEVWGVDQLVDQALLLGDEDEMPAADDTLREVQKGVSTYRMIRNFRNRIWSETFGYNKQEMLFAPFLKLQDENVASSLADWHLNPMRLQRLRSESEDPQRLRKVLDHLQGLGASGEAEQDRLRGKRRLRWQGFLPVTGTFQKGGVDYFYVDMAKGPYCIFADKAMVMEVWRDSRMVHVGAAILCNDWKLDPVLPALYGAYGRLVAAGAVQSGDQVAFPGCRQFHKNFQEFTETCLKDGT